MSNTMIQGGTHADIDELMEDIHGLAPGLRGQVEPAGVRSSLRRRKSGSSKTGN